MQSYFVILRFKCALYTVCSHSPIPNKLIHYLYNDNMYVHSCMFMYVHVLVILYMHNMLM